MSAIFFSVNDLYVTQRPCDMACYEQYLFLMTYENEHYIDNDLSWKPVQWWTSYTMLYAIDQVDDTEYRYTVSASSQ